MARRSKICYRKAPGWARILCKKVFCKEWERPGEVCRVQKLDNSEEEDREQRLALEVVCTALKWARLRKGEGNKRAPLAGKQQVLAVYNPNRK